MRTLLFLPWCFLFSLAGATDCQWKMPTDVAECTQTIKWTVHNDKQALATCLEHFPTTYVTASFSGDKITCTVSRHFQCNFLPGSIPIFDKCYTFIKKEYSMDEYLSQRDALCPESLEVSGALPIFYTMTQAKHIAKEAHRQGISKVWANVDKDGLTVEKSGSTAPKFLLYKDQWMLHKDHYWDGDTLKSTPKSDNNETIFGVGADYLFFRSRTDYKNNLTHGFFERATRTSKASIFCEYKAKIVPDQKKYCSKMGDQGLGINAIYDETRGSRCIYATLNRFALQKNVKDIKAFQGCREKPSDEHSSGIDDGTAHAATYRKLTEKGTYRIAALKAETTINNRKAQEYAQNARRNCDSRSETFRTNPEMMSKHREPFDIYNHFFKRDFAIKLMNESPDWEADYPKDECDDFEGDTHSHTLAIRKGKIIDLPTLIFFPVLCSIATNVDCELQKERGEQSCPRDDLVCVNVREWNPDTKHFTQCKCPRDHHEAGGKCKWNDNLDQTACGNSRTHAKSHKHPNAWGTFMPSPYADIPWDDIEDLMTVRNGCNLTLYGLNVRDAPTKDKNIVIGDLENLRIGEYPVPNEWTGTIRGWNGEMGVSAYSCTCADQP